MKHILISLIVAVALFGRVNPTFAADPPLKLTLSDNPLAVTFTNNGTTPLRILKPLNGSEHGWHLPYYSLSVTNSQGEAVPLTRRIDAPALWPYHKWPDDYVVVIPPGGTHTMELYHDHDIRNPGTFTLQFRYVFTPDDKKPSGLVYPPNLWQGEAISNTIKARLEPIIVGD